MSKFLWRFLYHFNILKVVENVILFKFFPVMITIIWKTVPIFLIGKLEQELYCKIRTRKNVKILEPFFCNNNIFKKPNLENVYADFLYKMIL